MKLTKTALCTALFATFTFSANAQTYPDLPVGIKGGTGALIGDTVYVGLGSGGDKFYTLDLKDPSSTMERNCYISGWRTQSTCCSRSGWKTLCIRWFTKK